MSNLALVTVILAASIFAFPVSASAYIGPGAGISAIGTFLAFIGAVLLAIVGFIWYPIKRLIRNLKKRHNQVQDRKS